MCHPYPGPACSEHALADYVDAIKAYELCSDPSESLRLRQVVQSKEAVYDSTVRGQTDLRRNLNELDESEDDKRFFLEKRQADGKLLRDAQLEAYRISVSSKRQGLKNELKQAGVHGRYEYALGFAYAYLLQHYSDWQLEIEDTASIRMTKDASGEHHRVFVLPQKYQRSLGEAAKHGGKYQFPADAALEETLNREGSGLAHPTAQGREALQAHFEQLLTDGAYDLIAHVNTTGELVALDTTTALFERVQATARLQARQSGTSNYTGEVASVERMIRGTQFEDGHVLKLEKPHRVVITGVLPQQKADCYVGDYFMSWRESTNSFLVKKRGGVVRESLLLKLQRREPVLKSQTTVAAASLLSAD